MSPRESVDEETRCSFGKRDCLIGIEASRRSKRSHIDEKRHLALPSKALGQVLKGVRLARTASVYGADRPLIVLDDIAGCGIKVAHRLRKHLRFVPSYARVLHPKGCRIKLPATRSNRVHERTEKGAESRWHAGCPSNSSSRRLVRGEADARVRDASRRRLARMFRTRPVHPTTSAIPCTSRYARCEGWHRYDRPLPFGHWSTRSESRLETTFVSFTSPSKQTTST